MFSSVAGLSFIDVVVNYLLIKVAYYSHVLIVAFVSAMQTPEDSDTLLVVWLEVSD